MSPTYKLVAANWKMNLLIDDGKKLLENLNRIESEQVLVCPTFTALNPLYELAKSKNIKIGAQNCNANSTGAFTGEISAEMIKDCGCDYVILGHSERREQHEESNDCVNQKAISAHKQELITIICVGESEEIYNSGKTKETLKEQLKNSIPANSNCRNTIIAYEPIWAIGTGKVPTLDEIADIHDFIMEFVCNNFDNIDDSLKVLYGGSVKKDNAKDIMNIKNVGGVLVGGASLDADSFNIIVESSVIDN